MIVFLNTMVQLSVHAHLHFYSRKRVTHLRRSKEWELIFPTPLSNKATRLDSIINVSKDLHYPTCMGTAHLTILTKAIHHSHIHSSWISPSPITNSHLTFKHFKKKKNPPEKGFLIKEFGTVSKIYFILKISEGKLEALRMSTEAPCYIFPLHSRYHLETFSYFTVQSVQVQKRLLRYLRHFILKGYALCHSLFNSRLLLRNSIQQPGM